MSELRSGASPTVGSVNGPHVVLRFSDGRRVPLRGMTLIGRHPQAVGEEIITDLVSLDDPGRSVSKTHLLVGMDARGLYVQDRHSTNGTIVTLPDGQQILCAAGQTIRVPGGSTVSFGEFSCIPDFHQNG
ncbi:FHA domain-containing protein [Sanguibacter gelidistatuariae]|uniref:FHA domain-containing protein n=1 Tax=Sanguibacter gelidistatuariae TaxID=1814289 RepID=UPI000A44BEF3|nr:FHA domain-containing protein [Sanguibacter gelidistatuariae]